MLKRLSDPDHRTPPCIVATIEEAETTQSCGSPSIIIDGSDPFAEADEPVGLSCRVYQTPNGLDGSPTLEQLRAVLTLG